MPEAAGPEQPVPEAAGPEQLEPEAAGGEQIRPVVAVAVQIVTGRGPGAGLAQPASMAADNFRTNVQIKIKRKNERLTTSMQTLRR